jgi:adenylate cyclase
MNSIRQPTGDDIRSVVTADFRLPRLLKLVLVVDLVESVRAMEVEEVGVIARWQAFLRHVKMVILPAHAGRLVKSLGDGLMVEFDAALDAVSAAADMHAWMADICTPLGDNRRLALRAGVHSAYIFVGREDVYGVGVNLAARVAALARPGTTAATTQVKDRLAGAPGLSILDLGEFCLKHIEKPVRLFQVDADKAADVSRTPGARLRDPTSGAAFPLSHLISARLRRLWPAAGA